jgi:hypothetical protein
MRGIVKVTKDGVAKNIVQDREEGENCEAIHKLTDTLGPQISEERTGPDCDTVHEVVN